MKKNLKKTFAKATALAMAVAMMVSVVPASSADAKAKNPKLAKSVKVTVKKTKKVKIKNTKKIKKTKWSIKSKKIATLSKKKKTSVVVKGKKAGSTKLTAKVTLKGKKKAKKLTMKVKVVKAGVTNTPTPKPTTKATTKPNPTAKTTQNPNPSVQTPTPAPTPDKFTIKDGDKDVTVEVDKEASKEIPVTELNETSVTCVAKHTDDYGYSAYADAEYTRKGLKFTTKSTYNDGAMFYLDPITSADDLIDAPEGKNCNGKYTLIPKEGKGGKVDIADYDYIRVTLFDSPYETNLRLYTDLDQFVVDGAGMVGTCSTFYGKDSIGRGEYVGKEAVEPGSSSTANHYYKDAAKTQDAGDGFALLPVSEAIASAKTSEFVALAVCGQFKSQEYGISKIELLKVKDSVPATTPKTVEISAAGNKTAIVNSDTLQLSAKVLNKNGTELEDTVTWSVEGEAATIDEETGLLTADAAKTGTVTVTATSGLDNTVKATYEVEVVDATTPLSIGITNKYTTYTIDELSSGLDIKATGLNGAGEPVDDDKQPAGLTLTASDASDGITYANGKLTATKAGSIKLTATATGMTDEVVTIKVVNGTRLELTEDNTGALQATSSVENGVLTVTPSNWNAGGWVKVQVPAGKTVANAKGILWNLKIAGAKNLDNKPVVVVRIGDLSKASQAVGAYGLDCTMWEGSEYTADDYAKGVDLEASLDWNFCYKDGEDLEVDTTGDTVCFTLGKNGDTDQIQEISNVIVLWGDVDPMPAVKSVEVSGDNEVAANRKLPLAATATHENDKTKTVTDTAEWTSSDTTTATVSKGIVTPIKQGKVTITAKVGDVVSEEYEITIKADKVVAPLTLTSTTAITSENGGLKFADCTNYPANFNVKDYGTVTYKVTAYNSSGEVIKDVSDMDNTKVCVNCSTGGNMYNSGYGDGYKKNIVKDGTLDSGSGEFTLTCDTLYNVKTVADCLSYQLDGGKVKKIVISEIKFE